METTYTKENQNVLDIVTELYGSIDYLDKFLLDNPSTNLEALPLVNTPIQYDPNFGEKVKKSLWLNNPPPANSIFTLPSSLPYFEYNTGIVILLNSGEPILPNS